MDNRQIDITSEGSGALDLALQLIWPNASGGKASHYKIVKVKEDTHYYTDKDGKPYRHYTNMKVVNPDEDGQETLIILWHEEKDSVPFAYPHTMEEVGQFVKGWLRNVKTGHQPDHDGSNGKGWRIFTDHWGHVAGHQYAICGVQFAWAMYGK